MCRERSNAAVFRLFLRAMAGWSRSWPRTMSQLLAKEKVQYIITACASCNGGIGEYYQTMKADYGDFTGKVIDFSVFFKAGRAFCRTGRDGKMAKKSRRSPIMIPVT